MPVELFDPTESRTVKPRRSVKPCDRSVVVLTDTHALAEGTGTLIPLIEPEVLPDGKQIDSYADQLYAMPPTIVVTFGGETLLYKLHEHWKHHPAWSWRVCVSNKHGRPLLRKRVAYFGFRDRSKKTNRYHLVLDAGSFYRKHDPGPQDLLELGIGIREFCNDHGLAVRASAAGLASQLLKHPMFYPHPRRRVPTFINEAVRPHLPGGHFETMADVGQRMETATYVDQEAAHHYAAMSTPLPNANSVRAQGYSRSDDRPWARKGGLLYERAMQNHGLVRARVKVPALSLTKYDKANGKTTRGQRDFVPPVMREPGERIAHLWTNEIPYLEQMGLEIEYLTAVWGTAEVDYGIAKYAQWARDMSRQYPHLKSMLLMPYGLLARHPGEVTYHHPGGEEPMVLANMLLTDTFATTVRTMPETANALQLGLIQSFVRSLSLDMARQAADAGHEIVSIYADGVFVKLTDGKQLPIFAPWRVKEEHIEIETRDAMRVPVRARIRRDYAHTK